MLLIFDENQQQPFGFFFGREASGPVFYTIGDVRSTGFDVDHVELAPSAVLQVS